jgi:hypothetical protein
LTFTNLDNRGINTFLYTNGPVNSFDDPTLLFKQTYKLESINGAGEATTLVEAGKVAPSYVGEASMPNYAALRDEAIAPLPGGGMSYVGQADDPFFLDLRVFDLLYGGDLSETGDDTLNGFNVNTVVLQVPTASLVQANDPVIGVWSTTQTPATRTLKGDGTVESGGNFVQVSRLGSPLVNEVVLPAGLKDAFNALKPAMDADVQPAVNKVNDPEVPKLIEQIYGIPAPATPRDDLFSVFLTGVEGLNKPQGEVRPAEMLRLNTSIPPTEDPNRLGVLAKDYAGFPNGRRLGDDVVDIELQALEGAVRTGQLVETLAAGDGVNSNDKAFGETFPYVALPHSGSSTAPHAGGSRGSGGTTPGGGVDAGAGGTAASASEQTPILPMTSMGLGALLGTAGIWSLRRKAATEGNS